MENYKDDPGLRKLAFSLVGWKISSAMVEEACGSAVLRMHIKKGGEMRTIEIGVSGNLYDEAYFVFEETKRVKGEVG